MFLKSEESQQRRPQDQGGDKHIGSEHCVARGGGEMQARSEAERYREKNHTYSCRSTGEPTQMA